MYKLILVTMGAFLLSSCSLMSRPAYETSVYDEEYAAYAAQKSGRLEAYEELGITPTKEITEEDQILVTKRLRLRAMERAIASEKMREQYYNYRPYLDTDEERIGFLSIPSYESRDQFAMQRGIYFKTNKFMPSVKEAISRSDIILGMGKEAVLEAWGEPQDVEVAGNKLYGNEKWHYVEYVSSPEGYQKEERVIIFESGRVVGWQKL